MGDNIYIPHALSYAGQVITMYDPIVHTVEGARPQTDPSPLRKPPARATTRATCCARGPR
jgi:hypothetical protein